MTCAIKEFISKAGIEAAADAAAVEAVFDAVSLEGRSSDGGLNPGAVLIFPEPGLFLVDELLDADVEGERDPEKKFETPVGEGDGGALFSLLEGASARAGARCGGEEVRLLLVELSFWRAASSMPPLMMEMNS